RSLNRRTALVLAAATALATMATACGSSGGDGASGSPSSASASRAERTVNTAMGEVKVQGNPKRVVVLDTDSLDSAITLGVVPVGATTVADGEPFSTYLPKEKLKDIKPVGLIGEPNLEAIAALKPDLILSSKVRDEKHYK